MKDGFRQSMAWLHTWSGLLVGWVLFMVFLAGTSAYFRDEISFWMKPELHAVARAAATSQPLAASAAVNFLQAKAASSPRWTVDLPSSREPALRASWAGPPAPRASGAPGASPPQRRGRQESATLDPTTGERMETPRQTRGGDFFYRLHFDLHYMPARWGRWIVGVCAMFMLVAIVSGVVTHKRIFKDFFTFRPKKGQRSWLDAHNATAVLALPYHLMITYTGLVTLMFMYMPWGPEVVYKGDQRTYISEVFPSSNAAGNAPRSTAPAPLRPVAEMAQAASRAWDSAPIARMVVSNPNTAGATVTFHRHDTGSLSSIQAAMVFDGATGALLSHFGDDLPAASQTRGVLYGLHLGRFSAPLVRWLFFLSGLAGSVMVATGLLLWAVKERQKFAKALAKGGRIGFGLRLVDGLNITAVAGLPLAMAVFFWANRLIPAGLAGRADLEIGVFFGAWALCASAGLALPTRRMWQLQIGIAGALLALVPMLNPLTGGAGLWTSMAPGLWRVAGFDSSCLMIGAALLVAARTIGVRKPAGARKRVQIDAGRSAATHGASKETEGLLTSPDSLSAAKVPR